MGELEFDTLIRELPLELLRLLDLSRALAHDPQLLLLDEITAALPADQAEHVFAVMREWKGRGRSVLVHHASAGRSSEHVRPGDDPPRRSQRRQRDSRRRR